MKKICLFLFVSLILGSCRNQGYHRPYIISNTIEDSANQAVIQQPPQ